MIRLLLLLVLLPAIAQVPDSFQLGALLSKKRSGHTATLLPSGKVLIAGGDCNIGPNIVCEGSSELFDPVTNTISPTGSMREGRRWHSATLLADGRVLIAGGSVTRDLNPAEIYDPATGRFTQTGMMPNPVRQHGATLLPDGRAFLGGGSDSPQIFDPSSGSFSAVNASVPMTRFSRLVRLIHSSILLITGQSSISAIYNPADQSWLAPENLRGITATSASACTLLPDGNVVISGGIAGFEDEVGFPTIHLYDPRSHQLQRAVSRMSQPRVNHTSTLMPDGTVLLLGGSLGFWDEGTDSAETFVPATRAIQRNLYTPARRIPASEILLVEGKQPAVTIGGTARLVSPQNPASAGDILEVYLADSSEPTQIPPLAYVGGRVAEVLYSGRVAGFPSLRQINLRIPAGTSTGDLVPLWFSELERPGKAVGISIR